MVDNGKLVQDLAFQLKKLGIEQHHIERCRLPVYPEAGDLVEAGIDMFNRPAFMTPATFKAWQDMRAAALEQDISLKLVSAFRSVAYQCEVISRKVAEGRSIDDVLCVNAIPGHSEHHTGCALDLHAGDGEPLTLAFESDPAFTWLQDNAHQFGFHMSYPRGNVEGIDYEPWHWCYRA